MKSIGYLSIGILFGIVMFKSGAASWFRIYEMFHFQSFHMFGIIGSALLIGTLFVQTAKRKKWKDISGNLLLFPDKVKGWKRYLFGGIVFGLGWALGGSCPGPLFTLLGAGFFPVIVVILGALLGTWFYGLIKNKLPH